MKRTFFIIFGIFVILIFSGCQQGSSSDDDETPILYSSLSSFEKYETYNGTLWMIEEVIDMGKNKITFKYDYDSSATETYIDVSYIPKPDGDSGKCRYTFTQTGLSDTTADRTFIVKDDLSGDIALTIPSDGFKKSLKCKNMNEDGSYSENNFVYETYYNYNGKRLYERIYDDGVLSQEKVDEYMEDGITYTKEVFYYRNQTESVYTIKDIVFPEYNAFNKCIRENRQVVREMGGINYDKYVYQFDWDPGRNFIVREAKYGYISDSVNEIEQISTWYNDTYDTINDKSCIVKSYHYSENKCDFFIIYSYDIEGNLSLEKKHSFFYNNKINDESKIESEKIWTRYNEGEYYIVKEETRSYNMDNQPDEPVASVNSDVRTLIDGKLRGENIMCLGRNDKIFILNEKSSFYKE